MEEFIGKIWHRYVTNSANTQHPEARVELDDIRYSTAIFFRALGGEGGLRIDDALETGNNARRSVMQRIAGTGKTTELAYRDEETLRLPPSIALFPSAELNRDLYIWLTAISVAQAASPYWLQGNQQRITQTLNDWPGLGGLYQRLVAAHIQQRPNPADLPHAEAEQERIIQQALLQPELKLKFTTAAKHAPQPVILWLHPNPPTSDSDFNQAPADPDNPVSTDSNKPPQKKQGKQRKKKAERTDMPDDKNGLMSFRLESLWSWSEYVKVDRSGTEDDNDDADRTADDMDKLTVAQDGETARNKVKLDLDLPNSQYDDIILGEGIPIDEWDYKTQKLQKDHCRLLPMVSREQKSGELPKELRNQARKVRRHFELLRPERRWLNRQSDGPELDLESYIHFISDRKRGQFSTDTPVYRQLRNQNRDLSCLLLADLSLSTDAHINDDARIIDVIRDALFLFSEALSATGDHFALHGFSSRNRNHVRFYDIKSFDSKYDETARSRINSVRPGYYTRMGAAIRHASSLLEKTPHSQKLLLILTDGKPNDLDKYEGRYGIEDTRMAVLEAQNKGLRPFCVTIDEQAEDYLPYLFGKQSYVLVRNAEELPRKLPLLYLRLTS